MKSNSREIINFSSNKYIKNNNLNQLIDHVEYPKDKSNQDISQLEYYADDSKSIKKMSEIKDKSTDFFNSDYSSSFSFKRCESADISIGNSERSSIISNYSVLGDHDSFYSL